MSKKFFIKTFGCQANKSDSERIIGDYQARGFKETSNWRKADEIIINSCAVRQRAEHRVVGFLLNIDKYFVPKNVSHSREGGNPVLKPKIILTGCMLHHGAKRIKEIAPQIDEILPINEVGFNSPAIRK
jgi:tRNA-2-methylthio-N6-dimethylallyladenosine synthase